MISQKKRGPAATGKGEPILIRVHEDVLRPLDEFIQSEGRSGGEIGRPEAARRILRAWLIEHAYLSRTDVPEGAVVGANRLTAEEDREINAMYASGEPGIGALFMRAMINHMRDQLRLNPHITVEQVKEFVLDVFDDYGQPLEEKPES